MVQTYTRTCSYSIFSVYSMYSTGTVYKFQCHKCNQVASGKCEASISQKGLLVCIWSLCWYLWWTYVCFACLELPGMRKELKLRFPNIFCKNADAFMWTVVVASSVSFFVACFSDRNTGRGTQTVLNGLLICYLVYCTEQGKRNMHLYVRHIYGVYGVLMPGAYRTCKIAWMYTLITLSVLKFQELWCKCLGPDAPPWAVSPQPVGWQSAIYFKMWCFCTGRWGIVHV
jgi:hypothetical protein